MNRVVKRELPTVWAREARRFASQLAESRQRKAHSMLKEVGLTLEIGAVYIPLLLYSVVQKLSGFLTGTQYYISPNLHPDEVGPVYTRVVVGLLAFAFLKDFLSLLFLPSTLASGQNIYAAGRALLTHRVQT